MADHLSTKNGDYAPNLEIPKTTITEMTSVPEAHVPVEAVGGVVENSGVSHTLLSGVEVANRTNNSIWKMIGSHLSHSSEFSNLGPEQQANVIDTLKNRVAENHNTFGFKNINRIKIGDRLDFSKLIYGKADLDSIINHAKNLTADQIENIKHNSEPIVHWADGHYGQVLTSPKAEDILSHAHAGMAQDAAQNVSEHATGLSGAEKEAILEKIQKNNASILRGEEQMGQPINHIASPVQDAVKVEDLVEQKASGVEAVGKYTNIVPGEKIFGVDADKLQDNIMKVSAGALAAAGGLKLVKELKNRPNAMEKSALASMKSFEKLAKEYKLVSGESDYDRAQKLMRGVAINSNEIWSLMKGAKFPEWKKGAALELVTDPKKKLTVKLTKNIEKLVNDMLKYAGEKAKPKKDETIFSWVVRVAKISAEKEKIEDLQIAA